MQCAAMEARREEKRRINGPWAIETKGKERNKENVEEEEKTGQFGGLLAGPH